MDAKFPLSTVQIIGIVNLTRDSYSDGGRYLSAPAAVAHARRLRADGATWVELGAESSHPDSEDVSAEEELRRLSAPLEELRAEGIAVAVDTSKPEVMHAVLQRGAMMINDINGFRDPAAIAAVHDSRADLVCMFNRTARAPSGRASSAADDGEPAGDRLFDELLGWAEERLRTLTAAGIEAGRIIIDPGMGYFLGANPELSLRVLRGLPRLAALGAPICVSPSRKSFIGATLRDAAGAPRSVAERGAGTLAAELWAATRGANFIRTHDVRALHDALTVWRAISGADPDTIQTSGPPR